MKCAQISVQEALASRLRSYLVLSAICCTALVLLGSGLNDLGEKYARVTGSAIDPSFPTALTTTKVGPGERCVREIFNINEEMSMLCCDGLRRLDWVCIASFDHVNRVMTSLPWAYVLPLAPWVMSALFQPSTPLRIHARRLGLYVVIMIFRVVVAYLAMGHVQILLNSVKGNGSDTEHCWYSQLRRDGKCISGFDFSDHLVFYYINYAIPAILEGTWVMHCTRTMAAPQTVLWFRFVPQLFLCLAVVVCSVRSMMFTLLYFHTPAESLAALVLILLAVVLPLYRYSNAIAQKFHQEPAEVGRTD